jgi:hypothetical protein
MKGLLLILAFALAALSLTAVVADHTNVAVDGYNWATRACSSAYGLCKYSRESTYAAVGCGVLWVLLMLVK